MVEDNFELGFRYVYLSLQTSYYSVTPSDRVGGPYVGLKDDGAHGVVFRLLVEMTDDFDNVADAEEFVRVEELAVAFVGEIRGENAVGCALSTLIFACGTSLSGGVGS